MGGLIPLLLPTSTVNRPSAHGQPIESTRPASAMAFRSQANLGHQRQHSLPLFKPTKPLSILTPASVHTLPETPDDWRKAISEVKRKYASRKYRTCSARCCEILDNLRDTSKTETLHLVYLHFYAASSFEMCARSLSQSTAYRTKLLDDAREHYDKASALIKKAEDAAIQRTRSPSSSSPAPASHSTSMSANSRSSTVCTAMSSPRNSISSVEEWRGEAQRVKPKKKKKVSFSGLPPEIEIHKDNWQSEPYIRPDSPTLGREEDYLLFGRGELAAKAVVTQPSSTPLPIATPKPVKLPSVPSPVLEPVPEDCQIEDTFNLESFLETRSMNRMITQLSALRSQVAWHRDNIDTLLTESDEVPEVPEVPGVPSLPELLHTSTSSSPSSSSSSAGDMDEQPSPRTCTPLTEQSFESALSPQFKDPFGSGQGFNLTSARLSMFSGCPEAWDHSRSSSVCSTASSALPPRSASQMSMHSTGGGDDSIQKRIERLRASGWQRKRFDTRRYEALREQVLSELDS
jgi:hypothetical protein